MAIFLGSGLGSGWILGRVTRRHAVFVVGGDGVCVDALEVEGALYVSGAALGVDVALAFFLLLFVQIGTDGKRVILYREFDLILGYAGQLCFQSVSIVILAYIHTESRGAYHIAHIEKRTEETVCQERSGKLTVQVAAKTERWYT